MLQVVTNIFCYYLEMIEVHIPGEITGVVSIHCVESSPSEGS